MRSFGICTAFAVLTAAPPLAADPCFCLQDAKDKIWYDCATWTNGLSPDPLYRCFPSTGALEAKIIDQGHRFKRIEAGQAPCDPCRAKAPDACGTMRPMGTDPSECPGSAP